jgi:hypothetical protein
MLGVINIVGGANKGVWVKLQSRPHMKFHHIEKTSWD